jgi:hypothetical protein
MLPSYLMKPNFHMLLFHPPIMHIVWSLVYAMGRVNFFVIIFYEKREIPYRKGITL